MEYTYAKKPKPKGKVNPPCPAPEPPPTETCCELVCFERPNYFCGHLLTDTDLTREQWYFREKNKLYHRTIHGHGIICGLRLTCDPECPGGVLIGEGYAIDDCGNDLVVCEPLRFDVIGVLRKKGYLVEEAPADPCKPKEQEPECKVRQCFYITICYQEEPTDFTTPFIAGCRAGPSECEPTRTREGVRFDVLAELPKEAGWLDDLKVRLETCFKLFSEGAFAQALQKHKDHLNAIINSETGTVITAEQCRDLFCELRGLLLLYLKKYPDKYNCKLVEEILEIPIPSPPQGEDYGDFREKCRKSICDLLELAWQHVVSCWLGELVPPCPEPSQAACIVLGTVEVENGRVVRVCNCPRSYVWSFAHFFEVLLATLMDGIACETDDNHYDKDPCDKKGGKRVCCREFDLNCEWILRLLRIDPRAPRYASTAAIDAATMLRQSLSNAFDFTRSGTFSPQIFSKMPLESVRTALSDLGVGVSQIEEPLEAKPPHPLEILQRIGLSTPDKPVVLSLSEQQGPVAEAHSETYLNATLAPSEREQLGKRIEVAEGAATNAQQQVQRLEERVKELEEKIVQILGSKGDESPPRSRGK
jgi:hypothetical protein